MISDGASRFVTRWAAGVLLLNLFVYTLAAFMLYTSWRGYETRVESSTQNLARIIESSVTGVVDKADVALRSVVDEAERQLAAGGIDAVAINGAIARQTARVPELDGIRLANADGEILYGSDVDPAAAVNVTDREYFQWVRDNPAAGTHISKPYVGRIAHRWVFALARRIEHADGRFAGVAIGVFPIQYFADFFSSINVGQDGAVVLRYDDMAVVARYPEVAESIGQTQVSPELTALLAAGKQAATYAANAVVDNIRRVYSYQKVPGLPFYVFVGQSLDAAAADWRNQALAMLVVLLPFTLVTVGFSQQLVRTWRQQQQAEIDLRRANQALEDRVAERTGALRASNERLQIELAERKQAEAALRESEGRFRSMLEQVRLVSAVLDTAGNITFVNDQLLALTGWAREEVMGRNWFDVFIPPQAPVRQDLFASVENGEVPLHYENEILTRCGEPRLIAWNNILLRDAQGATVGVAGIGVDITEPRRMETAEREQRALAEALRDTSSALARTLDLGRIWGEILTNVRRVVPLHAANIALLDEYGGLHYEYFMGYEDHPIVQEELDTVFTSIHRLPIFGKVYETGDPLVISDTKLHPDWISLPGSRWICSFAVMPIRINGRVVGFLNLDGATPGLYTEEHLERLRAFADQAAVAIENARLYTAAQQEIAERKRAEAALLQAKETAEAANRAKSIFLANMSHELRTPLNAILGFSELMVRDAGLNVDQRENLAIINRSGEHLLSLINDVLDMAKIEAGRTTLQEHDFDLHHLLADLVDLFHARAAAKGLTLTLAQAPETPRLVYGDAHKLRQVLINLLGNAIKFTAAGSVTLIVQVASAADVATGQGCRLCFTVEDTGPGIAPEDSERIFEPFVQVVRGDAIQEGTGLGLPISREYARLMGGALTVVSGGALGQGSSFRLEAPLGLVDTRTPAPAPVCGQRSMGLAAGQPTYRLLVAEDHAESRKLLADLLTGLGFAVRTAENGAEAVAIWQEWRPHLIWMDLRMPVMDGHAATRRIKATAEGQQTVIVAVSACVLSDEQTALHAADCDDFVRKPYRESEIVACLVKHLGVRMVYADAPATQAVAQPAFDLTGLPAAWLEQVRRAAVAADAAQLLRLAAEVEREWPTVTCNLCAAVDDFNYHKILTAIDQSRET